MRSSILVRSKRRILCVFPAYTPSFGTFAHAYSLMGRVQAFMPPQGLLLIAAYLPETWPVRFVDENIRPASAADFAWADVVFVSGMHIQADQIRDICSRAEAAGKATVLGGPSVSSAPEKYPEFDYLHMGEMGDATDELIARLDLDPAPLSHQIRLETKERLPLNRFPIPAYELVPLKSYLLGSLQFSSGCPYQCEFCDIPGLYGRQPRMKEPEQLLAELDSLLAQPAPPSFIYFVDDNFIGNKKATRDMLVQLVAWQKKHFYPLAFACEATLNLAKQADILELMREANFQTVFVGIETPDADALRSMKKSQNLMVPMLESIQVLNHYGLEVTSGIILGLDTDGPGTEAALIDFIDASNIPVLTINLLVALPKTPLWDRLVRDDRITEDPELESNVKFLRPHDEVVESWRRCIAHAYAPERLYARFHHQVTATYANRIKLPAKGQLTAHNLRRGATLAYNVATRIGIKADYRRAFWKAAGHALKHGQIDTALSMGFVGCHMIKFTREAVAGKQNASFYSARNRAAEAAKEAATAEQQTALAKRPLESV